MLDLAQFIGFEWDEGNDTKNWRKHHVTREECEQVFFNRPLLLIPDVAHSQSEPRYYVLGQTDTGRELFVVFTPRGDLLRAISARDMSRSERTRYGQEA
ncbi:MAG: BrnT family toxin [Planctomycetes bacterium]|nr:BrnT family toxin [Planctomycetota bacterium]